MDPRDLNLDWNRPQRTSSPAKDLITSLNAQLVWLDHHKNPREIVRIFYSGAFGMLRSVRISPEGADFVAVTVKDDAGAEHVIVASVSQCSFMFSVVVPTAGEPEEKVILGFAEGRET